MRTALIAFSLLTLLFSCNKKDVTYYQCYKHRSDGLLSLRFIGFTVGELDTIFIRVYMPGTNYTQLLGETLAIDTVVKISHDTASTRLSIGGTGSDYEVIIPAAMDTLRIDSLSYSDPQIDTFMSNVACINTGNGQLVRYPSGLVI